MRRLTAIALGALLAGACAAGSVSGDAGITEDAGLTDAGVDAGSSDAGLIGDAGPADAGAPGTVDAGDAGAADAGDAGSSDAGDAGSLVDAGDAGHPSDAGDAGPPVLAPPGDAAQSEPVDGISCDTSEQLLFHIHAHLAIYVNGEERLVAAGVGIGTPLTISNGFVTGGSCFSWLHTHDTTGVIHIESPVQRTFTLQNFFDIWGLALSDSQVGPAGGSVTAYLNGMPFTGDVTTIPLDAQNYIQLDVGTPVVPPQPYTFPAGL